MPAIDREFIQQAYIQICKDSGFTMSFDRAARFTADVLKIHPFDIWIAFGYLDAMKEIANGTHVYYKKKIP